MKQQNKLNSQEQQALGETQSQQGHLREFNDAEEMVRADAAQTPVPPAVTKRLNESLKREPRPGRSWWQRLTGR